MTRPGAADVVAALDEMTRVLGPHTGGDWDVQAGGLQWSCRETAAHVGHDLFTYAAQLTRRAEDGYLPIRLIVRPEAPPEVVLDVARASGSLLRLAVEASSEAGGRAWHYGMSDASGFAAMGMGEVLVHTFDIATGLGVDWRPPDVLAALVVERLLPEPPPGAAGDVLLWATGRTPLGDRPPASSWVWKAAR